MATPLTRTITLAVPGILRKDCGGARELPLEATSVREALTALEIHYPALHRNLCDETGAVRRHIALFVNSDHVGDRDGLDTPLRPGDVLFALPAVSGG